MLSYDDIKKILPHRFPFLLVDRVDSIQKGYQISGVKNISFSELSHRDKEESFYYPHALIIESLGQLAAILYLQSTHPVSNVEFIFGGAKNISIEGFIKNMDCQLSLYATIEDLNESYCIASAFATHDGKTILSIEQMYTKIIYL